MKKSDLLILVLVVLPVGFNETVKQNSFSTIFGAYWHSVSPGQILWKNTAVQFDCFGTVLKKNYRNKKRKDVKK